MGETKQIPAALPGQPRGFVNRTRELAELRAGIDESLSTNTQGVFVLTGLPGVGKTTLAAQCAHLVRELFPGGSLWATLGASAEAVTVEDVLAIFLTQLGVEKLPPTKQGLLAAFRAATTDLDLLVVLDDVESAAQLTNLLPVSSRSVVLATSRRRSEGFRRERFTVVEVPPFDPESAAQMVLADVGGTRDDLSEDGVRALAEVCGYLPLALSIATAHLSSRHRGPLGSYLERLVAARSVLTELTVDRERLVEAIFEISYLDLPSEERQAYRLLSLHPGTQFDLAAAAALLDVDEYHARDLLEALVTSSLLVAVGPDRYEFHSLVRQHATGLVEEVEHPADIRSAVARVVEWYLRFAVSRELVLSDRTRFGDYFDGRVAPAYDRSDVTRAVDDLERERPNLRRVVRLATEELLDEAAWQLCEGLFSFYFQRDLCGDLLATHTAGLASARRILDLTGDPQPTLRMLIALGTAYFSAQDNASAQRHFHEAAELAERLPGEEVVLVTRASAFVWSAFVYQRLGEPAAALDSMERARAVIQDPRYPEGQRPRERALLDMNSAPMLSALDHPDAAIGAARRAVDFFAAGTEAPNLAKSLASLGHALLAAQPADRQEVLTTLRRAIELFRELDMPFAEADASVDLADALESVGRSDEARPVVQRAVALFTMLDDRRAEALRDRLDHCD